MKKTIDVIGKEGLVPVVVIEDAGDAVSCAKAILEGGLNVMEITLRTQAGLQAIKNVSEACPEMIVGAGTVLSVENAQQAVDMGAQFIVSPGFNPEVVGWCVKNCIDITPGCVTPTEIEAALKCGINILKFFPASLYGGVNGCKALYGPYRMVRFIPTGGINANNLSDYADKPYVHAIGGGWLCNKADVQTKNFSAVTYAVKESVSILLGFELAHVGINVGSADESLALARQFEALFGFGLKEGNGSNFAGTGIEINKSHGLGSMGHVAVKTNNIERAIHYLGKRGFEVDYGTVKEKAGKMIAVYLKDEIGGFALHLLQK